MRPVCVAVVLCVWSGVLGWVMKCVWVGGCVAEMGAWVCQGGSGSVWGCDGGSVMWDSGLRCVRIRG